MYVFVYIFASPQGRTDLVLNFVSQARLCQKTVKLRPQKTVPSQQRRRKEKKNQKMEAQQRDRGKVLSAP